MAGLVAAIQGYAYFFRPAKARSTEESIQRLEILAEYSHLGAGYAIAMRDLEMRGAGEILGTRQHGYIATVGFHLYTRLLASAVRQLRGRLQDIKQLSPALLKPAEQLPATVDLPLHSLVPEDYISDRSLRLQLYRRMAEIQDFPKLSQLDSELKDRFGPPPEPVTNLLFQLKIKILATQAGIDRIATEGHQIVIEMPEDRPQPEIRLDSGSIRRSKRGLWLGASDPTWRDNLERILIAMKLE